MLKEINKIKEKALFESNYFGGLLELEKLEKQWGKKNYFLLAKGVLSDHLAMISKNKKKEFYQKKAIAAYKKVLEKDPQNLKAYYGLGRVELHQKNFDEGLGWYRKALKLKPEARFNKLFYAVALFWAKKYKKAEEIFMYDYRNHKPSFLTVYNLFLLERELKNIEKEKLFSREALRLWKKKPKRIRESQFGKIWEKEIRKTKNL